MSFTVAGKNIMLDRITDEITHVTIFSDNDGNDEIHDTEDEMQRQEVNWEEAEEGQVYAENEPEFSIPEGTAVRAVGFYDGPNEEANMLALDADVDVEEYANEGLYRLTQIRLQIEDE